MPFNFKVGDTIGIYSPSSFAKAYCPSRFERSLQYLTEKGFKIKLGNLIDRQDGNRSATIKERADELNSMIRDPEVKCIMASIGGYVANSILPYIDYEQLKKTPKVICGYSDITAILMAVYAKTKLEVYHGPTFITSFGEFGDYMTDFNYKSFKEVIIDNRRDFSVEFPDKWALEPYIWDKETKAKPTRPQTLEFRGKGTAKVQGRLIGGNLSVMSGIWGTEYMPEICKGDIIYLESCFNDDVKMERAFSHLLLYGVFDKVSAIVLGKHDMYEGTRPEIDILEEILATANLGHLPILLEFDSAHTHPMITLPMGGQVMIDFEAQKFYLLKKSAQSSN